MYVCICAEISVEQLKNTVLSGLIDLESVQEHLNIAQGCGRCAPFAEEVIKETLQESQSHRVGQVRQPAPLI